MDAVICDPPYALGFMGKAWDKFPTDKGPKKPFANRSRESKLGGHPFQEWCQTWAAEALRVAKPGAYLLAFGGTRTFHRLACAIEDAGWVLKDTLSWNYGSGFPKSKNIALAIDKGEGHPNRGRAIPTASHFQNASDKHLTGNPVPEYEAKGEAAKQWGGFGTALKPAWEPIILAQAPLEGTYAENVLKWGCGALNIGGCRIGADTAGWSGSKNKHENWSGGWKGGAARPSQGRWPANFLMSHSIFCEKVGEKKVRGQGMKRGTAKGGFGDGAIFGKISSHRSDGYVDPDGLETVDVYRCVPDCPVAILDGQSGTLSQGHAPKKSKGNPFGPGKEQHREERYFGKGGASRFFYCAKASRRERNAGLEELNTLWEKREAMEEKQTQHHIGQLASVDGRPPMIQANNHPTVKPIALMRYLCRLVTPSAGIVLDPFMGSGSTGCAAALEGFQFVGIEKEAGYAEIAKARISHFSQGLP